MVPHIWHLNTLLVEPRWWCQCSWLPLQGVSFSIQTLESTNVIEPFESCTSFSLGSSSSWRGLQWYQGYGNFCLLLNRSLWYCSVSHWWHSFPLSWFKVVMLEKICDSIWEWEVILEVPQLVISNLFLKSVDLSIYCFWMHVPCSFFLSRWKILNIRYSILCKILFSMKMKSKKIQIECQIFLSAIDSFEIRGQWTRWQLLYYY